MTIVTAKRLALSAYLSAGIASLTGSSASALDEAYCGAYADRAVTQTKIYQARACKDPGNSQWWSTVRDYHLNWCKTLPDTMLAEKGIVDRDRILAACDAEPTKDALCRELRKRDTPPGVCGWDFARDKTLAEACRIVRHKERLERIEQAAAQSSRQIVQQMQSDLDNYLIRKDEDYAWKIGVSSIFFATGLWAGAAMETAGLGFGHQLLAGAALSMAEEQIEQVQWNAALEALTMFDWKDGVASDASIATLESAFEKKLAYEFAKSDSTVAAQYYAKEVAVAIKPMFAALDLFRRVAKLMPDAQSLSYEEALKLLGEIDYEIAILDGTFNAATHDRKMWLVDLQQSGCE
jgi:hypothetical protein